MTVHQTIELSEADAARLEEIAKYHGVSITKLVMEGAERILAEDMAYLAAVQKGIDDIEAGRVFTDDEVAARSARRREELLARAQQS